MAKAILFIFMQNVWMKQANVLLFAKCHNNMLLKNKNKLSLTCEASFMKLLNNLLKLWSIPPDRTSETGSDLKHLFRTAWLFWPSAILYLFKGHGPSGAIYVQSWTFCLTSLDVDSILDVLSTGRNLFCDLHKLHPHIMMLPPPYFS